MRLPRFNYITHTPLWKIQKEDDEYLVLTLPVALFGMLNSLFYILVGLTAWLSHEMIIRVNQDPTNTLLLLENPILLIPITLVVSFVILFFFYLFSVTFSQYNFFTEFNNQVSILSETLDIHTNGSVESHSSPSSILRKELFWVYFLGLFAGMYYCLKYVFLYLLLYIFFDFILINFTSFPNAITSSMLLSWVLLSIYIVRQKLIVEEIQTRKLDPHADYGYTDRTIEILASNEPPIVCPGCRSYISANSRICNVCGEKIDD